MKQKRIRLSILALVAGMTMISHAEIVVNLEFNTGYSDKTLTPAARTDYTVTDTGQTLDWNDSVLLFDGGADLSQNIYGAYKVFGATATYSPTVEKYEWGGNTYLNFIGNNDIDTVDSRIFILWDSVDFITPGYNTFDTTPDSFISVTLQEYSSRIQGYHFVIRDNGAGSNQYYICSVGSQASASINGFSTEGLQWASFDPANWANFDENEADLGLGATFSDNIFSNITGVGLIADVDRTSNWDAQFRLTDFQVGLVSKAGTYEAKNATVIDLNLNGVSSPIATTRTDIFSDIDSTMSQVTLGYNTIDPLFTEPGSEIPIFGGTHITGDAGSVSNFYITMDSSYLNIEGLRTPDLPAAMNACSIMIWDADNFLTNGYTAFDNSVDSSIKIDLLTSSSAGTLNAVIRDGDTYYISSDAVSGWTPITLNITGAGSCTWAAFDPNNFTNIDYSAADFGIATNDFASRTFENVTAVGFIGQAARTYSTEYIYNPTLRVSDIVVKLVKSTVASSPYNQWAEKYAVNLSDKTADYDGDGVANYAEFIVNGDPTNSANTGHTDINLSGLLLRFIYVLPEDTSGITYRVLDTEDLLTGSWRTNGFKTTDISDTAIDGYTAITNTFKESNINKRFIKLELDIP